LNQPMGNILLILVLTLLTGSHFQRHKKCSIRVDFTNINLSIQYTDWFPKEKIKDIIYVPKYSYRMDLMILHIRYV
jgi:hypothetical protein